MLSPERKEMEDEPIDPVLLAYSRFPFRWFVGESNEVPFSLHCFGERAASDAGENPPPLEVAMNWMPQDVRPHNLHIEFIFFHRPLQGKVLRYDAVEGKHGSLFFFALWRRRLIIVVLFQKSFVRMSMASFLGSY